VSMHSPGGESEPRTWKPTDPYRPFSNGTEHLFWLEMNCMRGERGCRKYNPDASSSRHGCPIEVGLAIGNIGGGDIKASTALRGGFLEPGPNGLLVEAPRFQPCPEYKGYDEPDDRPRRGPRPPKEQLDLLDPRNAPDRPKVASEP
jgi:hypothetical protein